MKKKVYYLFTAVVLFASVLQNVYADDYKVNTLIPVNTVASVETDKFDYRNFTYNTAVDAKGNATLKFEAIQNNTLSKTAISINVLLFDENKKNIGFLTYCTDKDVSSDNAGFKIRANQAVPFTITVTSRYFVGGKFPKDVRYIAVRDENRYCQIGGYTNFKDLTIEEIVNGVEEEQPGLSFPDFSSYVNMTLVIILFAIIAVIGMIVGIIKLLKNIKIKVPSKKPAIKKSESKDKKDTNNHSVDANYTYNEADKPIDLNSFYNSKETESSSSIDIPETSNDQATSLEDIYTQTTSTINEPKVDETTKAVPVENLYNSISELPEEKPSKNTDSSINDLYNSINGASDSDNKSVSIDDLYESINNDDDDDDDDTDE